MAIDLFTLRTYWNSVEAHIARNQLEVQGIRAVVTDQGTGTLFGSQLGGAKLLVESKDAARAAEILGLLDEEEEEGEDLPADCWREGAEESDGGVDGSDDQEEGRRRPAKLPPEPVATDITAEKPDDVDDGPLATDSILRAKGLTWTVVVSALFPLGLSLIALLYLIHPKLAVGVLRAVVVFLLGLLIWAIARWFDK